MTDDLIKRLRLIKGVCDEAADALEAQAKRIAELEVECSTPRTNTLRRLFGELTARAEKAEADLDAARSALVRWTATAVPGCSDWEIIAAARGEQPSPVKPCETCKWSAINPHSKECDLGSRDFRDCMNNRRSWWQPKSDVCPTCEGKGMVIWNSTADQCPDCDGTGKKETK